MKKIIKITIAIIAALAFKYSILFTYSGLKARARLQSQPEYSQLKAEFKSKHFLEFRPQYLLWDSILYF